MSSTSPRFRIAGFPGRYLQGPGALGAVGGVITDLGGRRPMVVSDDLVDHAVGQHLGRELQLASLSPARLRFGGECTRHAIEVLAGEARRLQGDLVVALGGGKAIDTAKGVSRSLGVPLVVVPTIASNDSATSRLIVLYDESHRVLGVELLDRNPDAVVVDTATIVRAPVRFFRAGIGDAMSKAFEAAQCHAAGGRNFHGGLPPRFATALGEYCYRLLRTRAEAAVDAVTRGVADEVAEDVIEATVLLSGLAFESGGLSVAHALLRGLSAVPGLQQALHGEMVSFGTVVQMVLENRPQAELDEHLAFSVRVGLPVTLAELGQEVLDVDELDTVARLTVAAPYIAHFERPLAPADLGAAVLAADALGRVCRGA